MENAASISSGDDRQDVQKKTFGKWLNSQLASAPPGPPGRATAVTDLFHDLRDGLVLLSVLEALTGRKVRRERGNLRVHQGGNSIGLFWAQKTAPISTRKLARRAT